MTTPKNTGLVYVSFPADDVKFATLSLIAASSQLEALAHRYKVHGKMSPGAISHAVSIIDTVIERLGLSDMEIDETALPF